jgi:hypothetical protein
VLSIILAPLPEQVVQLFLVVRVRDAGQDIAPHPAYKPFDQAFLVALAWVAELAREGVVGLEKLKPGLLLTYTRTPQPSFTTVRRLS